MMKIIIAIGGAEVGELNNDGTLKPVLVESAHIEIIARSGKMNPKVLYIPTAKNDSETYIECFKKYYETLGCKSVDVLRLLREKPTKGAIAKKISNADIIYVNGGNTHRMMKIWRKLGIDVMLKKAYIEGTVMSGHSAGAICWFNSGDSNSFGDKHPFNTRGLGLIDAVVCPHYDTDSFRRTSLKRIMKDTPKLVAITLDECVTIEIIDNQYRVFSSADEAKARRTYWKSGRYITEEINQSTDFSNLQVLLTKPV